MSPSDEVKGGTNSSSGEGQSGECLKSITMDGPSDLKSTSKSDVTLPGTVASIPMITASLSTLKCSINDQMKTFDPGEENGIERLTSNHCGNSVFLARSSSGLSRISNKNYKAGSKINKLADMLAKRSQNVVEVTQNNATDKSDISVTSKCEDTVTLKDVGDFLPFDKTLNDSATNFEKTAGSKKLNLFRKSRRKSVPNQSCNFNNLHIQSTSKSCLDLSTLFTVKEKGEPEFNALGESLNKLQTDESTNRKAFRKNLKNIELTHILPEKKRRFSGRNENLVYNKINEKVVEISSETTVPTGETNKNIANSNEAVTSSVSSSPVPSINDSNTKKESKLKQRKSKRLVETSTQTADLEFIGTVNAKHESDNSAEVTQNPSVIYNCLYCSQSFSVEGECRDHEKAHLLKNVKLLIKCQYCSKKSTSPDELKSHCFYKHPNKYIYCMKCDKTFLTKEELYAHNKKVHFSKNCEDRSEEFNMEEYKTNDEDEKKSEKRSGKQNLSKAADLKIDVSFDSSRKSSSVSPRNIQKTSPKEIKTEEQLLEMEMLFYSHLSGNIQENLTNHLDGKMGQNEFVDKANEITEFVQAKAKTSNLLSVVTSSVGGAEAQVSRAPSPYKTRSKTPNPLPPTAKKFKKLPNWQQKFWEKYNFPTNYRFEHRFWDKNYLNTEKSAFYLKDLCCLDLKTQLIMKENIKKLDAIKVKEDEARSNDNLKFPDYLCLIPNMSIENNQECNSDSQKEFFTSKDEKQSCKEREKPKIPFKPPGSEMTATKTRRKLSSDNLTAAKKTSEKSEVGKMMTRRQSSIDLMKNVTEEGSRTRKTSLDNGQSNQRMILRRQASSDNIQKTIESTSEENARHSDCTSDNGNPNGAPPSPTGLTEISGEWVRPRSYLCGTCCSKFTNLWELEDHKWVTHPNVWCTHYEFEDDKIAKLFQINEDDSKEKASNESSNVKLTDLYKRYLLPHGSLKTAKLVPNISFPEQCTKCKKNCMNSSEMHKHMLDCGGDTTWFLTMYSSPMSIKRKWRPFGSRRRKQIGRRDLKRNIPSTPNIRSYHYQHRIRTKPGDVESIQKMLANLPEKRARRAINFDEIKTRSQATIHSNRLLRKRFKSSFGNNFLKLKTLRQRRQLKKEKKDGSSKSTTDASSESTPTGSPKRRNKIKDNGQLPKEENVVNASCEGSSDWSGGGSKRKAHDKKNKTPAVAEHQQSEIKRVSNRKNSGHTAADFQKPKTRSNGVAAEKTKRKSYVVQVESCANVSSKVSPSMEDIRDEMESARELIKMKKKLKNNSTDLTSDILVKEKNVTEFVCPSFENDIEKAISDMESKQKVKKKKNTNGDFKRKEQWMKIQNNSILRLQRNSKKTESPKTAETLKSCRKTSERDIVKFESRRSSSRLKSLQNVNAEGGLKIFDGSVAANDTSSSDMDYRKDSKMTALPVETSVVPFTAKSKKARLGKNSTEGKNQVSTPKDTSNLDESPIRRSSRSLSLRNSFSSEERSEMNITPFSRDGTENLKRATVSRRNSKNAYDKGDVDDFLEKKLRVDSARKSVAGKRELVLVSKQEGSSVVRKARSDLTRDKMKADGCDTVNGSKFSDLEEMPILAKVEPIQGKFNRKNEEEIPVLMPVVDDATERKSKIDEIVSNENYESVSFQVVKKRKNTSKEVTPLKIIKKVDSGRDRNKPNISFSFEVSKETKKAKIKKVPVAFETNGNPAGQAPISRNLSAKKYFLGICPSEIDKGKGKANEDSGSDSEPLITLVNQSINRGKTILNKIANVEIKGEEEEDIIRDQNNFKNKRQREKETHVGELKPQNMLDVNKDTYPNSITEDVDKSYPTKSNAANVAVSFDRDRGDDLAHPSPSSPDEKLKIKNHKKKKILDAKLSMSLTLKEPTLKIPKCLSLPRENKWAVTAPGEKTGKESELCYQSFEDYVSAEKSIPERRSRRISRETKSSNEFVIDDPLILVDELWSDLDSDSENCRKRLKKGRKKIAKKKAGEERKLSEKNLEELLRNFGENKEAIKTAKNDGPVTSVSAKVICNNRRMVSRSDVRRTLENRARKKSYKRLSLKLFRFNKTWNNFGCSGVKLCDAKKSLHQKHDLAPGSKGNCLPDLPFLTAEIKENPMQIIQCRSQKAKPSKKGQKKSDSKLGSPNIHLKISLPLESINNMTVFNNNNLTELEVEKPPQHVENQSLKVEVEKELAVFPEKENFSQEELMENGELKYKVKRSDVIDKIFYCEICQTYYYSSSQLKIHKLSNRHKLKESELLLAKVQAETFQEKADGPPDVTETKMADSEIYHIELESLLPEPAEVEIIEPDRQNDDTLEMPILEGPFIENPLARLGIESLEPPPQPPPQTGFGFTQDSLKDIQRAIGCTDEEMLILTLLGENTIEIENDILDLDECKTVQSKHDTIPPTDKTKTDFEKTNGILKVDLKQRMTSALACLVNKAVFNLLQKYESIAKTSVNPEAVSLLGKLSSLSRRKNILQLNELLKKQKDGLSFAGTFSSETERKEPSISYKYQCTICGSRFEKASTRECHISRSHKGKAKKFLVESPASQTPAEDDWNDYWAYDDNDESLGSGNMSQFWCSDCGINFVSPQEVLEHQKLEHQAGLKEADKLTGPLQSSTIGSSDEIIEGKKVKRRSKVFSSEELNQQRIIANNELRKLDRKFSSKNKSNKIKWGMDALRFTVEKENKVVVVEEEEEEEEVDKNVTVPDAEKSQSDLKNIDLVPKLNFSRTSKIPEFKVIQKNSLKNRFQKIIDNKLKRKGSRGLQQDAETDDLETEVMLLPVVVKKKTKKQRGNKSKKNGGKNVDVYDFNESESESEPMTLSHAKKQATVATKLKIVKVREGPSKNKADSTTKDLIPDDYDSEDSLPLSIVKKSKSGEEDDEKYEKTSEDGVEKSEGILEQVEYLIEQLENETGTSEKKVAREIKKENCDISRKEEEKYASKKHESADSLQRDVRPDFSGDGKTYKSSEDGRSNDKWAIAPPTERISAEPESSHSAFDEEDSMPLVLMSKRVEESRMDEVTKKCDGNMTDVSTTASEDVPVDKSSESKGTHPSSSSLYECRPVADDNSLPDFALRENKNGKSSRIFESLDGNVIYCRNESASDFGSDSSNDGLISSRLSAVGTGENDKNLPKEVTEKEDVIIFCTKRTSQPRNTNRMMKNRLKSTQKRKLKNLSKISQKKKKRLPLLTATIDENNFRKSESPNLAKEDIVKKIWNRRKLIDGSTDDAAAIGVEEYGGMNNTQNEDSQTEIDKEIIVKKIWSRKKLEHEGEFFERPEDVKINQTEISDEVVIKCGPKSITSPKRRKSRSSITESAKETIMRKIWSGKCTFQTKAALKTYDGGALSEPKDGDPSNGQASRRKRGRPAGLSSAKRSKVNDEANGDEDDLDSLLEEIEREQLEKAIRLEFLQLRRSEKANVGEIMKEGSNQSMGLFTETSVKLKKDLPEKRRKKIRRSIRHPRQSLIKRKRFLKKPIRRVLPSEDKYLSEKSSRMNQEFDIEQGENLADKNPEFFKLETKMKSRKHKKHRRKHHHHKHKHKKSKHHKCIVNKRKSKYKFDEGEEVAESMDSFTILEKICQDIPNQIENELHVKSTTSKKINPETNDCVDDKAADLSPQLFSFEDNTKDCDEIGFEGELAGKTDSPKRHGSVYEFAEDASDVSMDENKSQNLIY